MGKSVKVNVPLALAKALYTEILPDLKVKLELKQVESVGKLFLCYSDCNYHVYILEEIGKTALPFFINDIS